MKTITCHYCGRELKGVELLSIDGVKVLRNYNFTIFALATYTAFCAHCSQFVYSEKEIDVHLEEIAKGELEC